MKIEYSSTHNSYIAFKDGKAFVLNVVRYNAALEMAKRIEWESV